MPEVLTAEYERVQQAAEQEMAQIKLATIVDKVRTKIKEAE